MTNQALINIANVNNKILEIQRAADTGGSPPEYRGEGIVLLKNFAQGSTNSGKPKYTGTIANIDEVKFNVWNNSSAYEYFDQLSPDVRPHVVWISYSLSKYGLVISSIKDADGFNPDSFIYHKYSAKEKAAEFVSALNTCGITDSAISVIRAVFHMDYNDAVSQRIVKEYAAYSHHDNCATGLLAHTTKCIHLYNGIKKAYSFLEDSKVNDLMVISLALHDVGKIYEMHDGVYQKYSFLTHRGLGLEHLLQYKKLIVDLYDEEFFYMIDDLEAQLTTIGDLLQDNAITRDSAGAKVKYNGGYLNILQNSTS